MKNVNMKKHISFLLVLAVLATTVVAGFHLIPSNAEAASYRMGDVDNDGEVTAGDARLALRAAVGLENLTDDQIKRADMDKNGSVTADDARTILRISVGLEESSVVDEPGEEPTNVIVVPPAKPTEPHKEVLYIDNLGHEWSISKEALIARHSLCPFCEKVDCISLPEYNDGSYEPLRCPQYDMFKDPNPDYSKVCRYCGKTDCLSFPHGDVQDYDATRCPRYNREKDPLYFCEYCGKPIIHWDGKHGGCWYGGCERYVRDMNCPDCGEFCKAFTCHTCKH